MLQAFVITLREGLEAFLIVAISLAYLRKTGRHQLVRAVHWAIGVSVLVSIGAAMLFQRANNQALWEGVLALTAAALVATLIVHMWRHAKRLKKEIETRLESSALQTGAKALAGVFLFTLVMITREGMETALLLIQVRQGRFLLGCGLGLLCAAALASLWARFGHRINLKRFFQVTGLFLLLFSVQIVFYAIHEFSEAEILPNSETIHLLTEPYSADGRYSLWIMFGIVALCGAWLAGVTLVDRHRQVSALQSGH